MNEFDEYMLKELKKCYGPRAIKFWKNHLAGNQSGFPKTNSDQKLKIYVVHFNK